MATRTAAEIFRDLLAAGFNRANAIIMTAISLGESGGDDSAKGDIGIQTATWGPSYGLYQIRTLKDQTGKGTDRDITHLAGDDAAQADAAYSISHGGTDFSPWTVYTTGKYQQYLDQAQKAASAADAVTTEPIGLTGDVGKMFGSVRDSATQGVFIVFGIVLVLLGLNRAFAPIVEPAVKRTIKTMQDKGKEAAAVAVAL